MISRRKILLVFAVILEVVLSAPQRNTHFGVVSEDESGAGGGNIYFGVKDHTKKRLEEKAIEEGGKKEGKQLFKDDEYTKPSQSSLPDPYAIYLAQKKKIDKVVDKDETTVGGIADQDTALFLKPPTLPEDKDTPLSHSEGGLADVFSQNSLLVPSPSADLPRLYGLPEETPEELPEQTVNVPVKIKPFEEETEQQEVIVPPPNQKNMKGMLMPFNYQWQVEDPDNDDLQFSHISSSDGLITQGEYRVLLPDGRMQVVKYSDDGNGFSPQISYI